MNTPNSTTQRAVLETLWAIKAEGLKRIAALDAKAIGGLTQQEKNEIIGVRPDGQWIGNAVCLASRRVAGASYRTLQALVRAGLACRENDVFIAV